MPPDCPLHDSAVVESSSASKSSFIPYVDNLELIVVSAQPGDHLPMLWKSTDMKKQIIAIALVAIVVTCSRDDATSAEAGRNGRVQIVYDHAGIKPENRDAVKLVKDSGAFERFADRTNNVVALPHDIVVRISDDMPQGFDDPTTDADGRTIFWPAEFFTWFVGSWWRRWLTSIVTRAAQRRFRAKTSMPMS
jgi:hypothetical protein